MPEFLGPAYDLTSPIRTHELRDDGLGSCVWACTSLLGFRTVFNFQLEHPRWSWEVRVGTPVGLATEHLGSAMEVSGVECNTDTTTTGREEVLGGVSRVLVGVIAVGDDVGRGFGGRFRSLCSCSSEPACASKKPACVTELTHCVCRRLGRCPFVCTGSAPQHVIDCVCHQFTTAGVGQITDDITSDSSSLSQIRLPHLRQPVTRCDSGSWHERESQQDTSQTISKNS